MVIVFDLDMYILWWSRFVKGFQERKEILFKDSAYSNFMCEVFESEGSGKVNKLIENCLDVKE